MNLSHEQASSALQDIAQAQRRLGIFTGYRQAAPHLWLWGAIWIVGYAISDLWPAQAGWGWLVLNSCGMLAAILIGRQQARQAGPVAATALPRGQSLRVLGIALAIVLFIIASFDMLRPQTMLQYGSFPVLLMGLLYTLAGLWAGPRWLVTGLALSGFSLLGYHFIEQHALLWVGLCGGATLILSGTWMRAQ